VFDLHIPRHGITLLFIDFCLGHVSQKTSPTPKSKPLWETKGEQSMQGALSDGSISFSIQPFSGDKCIF
jgi:hypothetical protein